MQQYVPLSKRELSLRKQRTYAEFAQVVNWGRANPLRFAEHMFGIKLMDFQAYAFMESWTRPFVAWLMCRGAGKTTVVAVFLMTKLLLIPNYRCYVCATSAQQSIESFKKLEDIACNRIPSFKGLTDIFRHELVAAKGSTGFGHNPAGHRFELYNGSELVTLSSNVEAVRGKRGSVWYDEAAFVLKEQMDIGDHFANVDADFALGTEELTYQAPRQMPLQLIYTSSAGSAQLPFYEKIRAFTKHMLAGNRNYFVCDFDVNLVLEKSTVNGKPIKSHLNVAQIEKETVDNPENADRELYNHFRRGAGKSAVVTDDCLLRNSRVTLPKFYNETGKEKFIFCYDPARNTDNSILSIFEVVLKRDGYHLNLVNVISMVNREAEKKTPLNYVDQLDIIREAMLAYNGNGAADWENIEFYIDAGAGGAPRSGIADQLLFPWKDRFGVEHRGIIDPVDAQYETDRRKHPDNARIVHLLEPKRYKVQMYGALEELANLNLIHFTEYDGHKDYLMIPDEDVGGANAFVRHDLTSQEREALVQIELAKNELSYMCRYENPASSTVTYDLVKDRQHRMHDDRAYTIAMGAYALWLKRNKDLRSRKTKKNPDLMFQARIPTTARFQNRGSNHGNERRR